MNIRTGERLELRERLARLDREKRAVIACTQM